MHPRPLNEKGGNDSMCASIGQQTKEQTTPLQYDLELLEVAGGGF